VTQGTECCNWRLGRSGGHGSEGPAAARSKLPWSRIPAVSAVSTDHGRRARRTIKAVLAPAWIEFGGAAQVAQMRRTVTKNGKKTVEVVYLITSDRDADPATLAAGPQPRGDRKPSSLGEGRDLPGGQIAGQDGKRASRDGVAAQPGHSLRLRLHKTVHAETRRVTVRKRPIVRRCPRRPWRRPFPASKSV
jgi:hypothetical protein